MNENTKTKKVNSLKLRATACEMVDEKTNQKVEFIRYQLVIDNVTIGIGANDKFKELLKYLTDANSLSVGESVTIEVK